MPMRKSAATAGHARRVRSSAWQAAAESRSNEELQTGITIGIANMTMRARSKPCIPPGVSRITWVIRWARASILVNGSRERWRAGLRYDGEARNGWMLAIHIAQHDGHFPGVRTTQPSVRLPCFLPLPPLRLTTAITGMKTPEELQTVSLT